MRNPVIATNCGALAEPTHGVGWEGRVLADFGGAFFHDAGVEDVMGCDGADLVGFGFADGNVAAAQRLNVDAVLLVITRQALDSSNIPRLDAAFRRAPDRLGHDHSTECLMEM